MSTKEEVLKKLIDSNDYVSGEMLAKEIGVSRASVWKAIKTLQKAGYDIEGVTKCGYKLNQNNKIVSAQDVKSLLKYDLDVSYFESIDSTNTYCKRLLADDPECFDAEFLVIDLLFSGTDYSGYHAE